MSSQWNSVSSRSSSSYHIGNPEQDPLITKDNHHHDYNSTISPFPNYKHGKSSVTDVPTVTTLYNPNNVDLEKNDTELTSSYHSQNVDTTTMPVPRHKMLMVFIKKHRTNHRDFLAEFIGTLVLVLLTCGVSAEQTLHIEPHKSWLTSSVGSGLAVLVAVCIAGHVSGAHINPAVTIAFWLFSGFPTKKVIYYITAQMLGAFTGAALLYSIIEPAITQFDHGERQVLGEFGTAGIFGTYPPLYVGITSAIASEIIGTALLLLVIMASGHPNNIPFRTAQGVMIAAGVMTICLTLGYTSGFSLNPARDFGPRLFTAVAGWGLSVFTVHHYYALVPMLAPIFGAIIGGSLYTLFIDQ